MSPRDLHGLLTATDAASPPPPAVPFSPERMASLLRQRRLRTGLLATTAIAATAITVMLLRATPIAAAPAAASAASLQAFREEVRAGMALLEQRLAAIDTDRAAIDHDVRRGRLACDRAITAGQQFTLAYASFDPVAAARQRAAFAAMHAGQPADKEHR